MAPAVVQQLPTPVEVIDKKLEKSTVVPRPGNKFGYKPGATPREDDPSVPYESDFAQAFPDVHWDPLVEQEYTDKGILGDPDFKNLLEDATDVFDYSPKIGTEIHGIDLRKLTDAQKNDLARLIATRGVVFFRDQDEWTVEDQLELGRYFGSLHKHATTAVPKREGLDEIHVVYADDKSKNQQHFAPLGYFWHSDVTYEIQPPSYTSLKLLCGPPRGGGGDTLWSSQYAAYDALSPAMQKYLEGLTALHCAQEQAEGSRRAGRPVRREPVTTEHPIVRTHPVTGWKSLFINPGFVRAIVGVPKHESDAILKYLNDVIVSIPENHVRFQWRKNSVAFWDNRITNHSATYHFWPHRRHAIRVTPIGEKPYFDSNGKSQEEELDKALGRPPQPRNGAAALANYND